MKIIVEKFSARGLTPVSLIRALPAHEPCMIWESSSEQHPLLGTTTHAPARFSVVGLKPAAVARLQHGLFSLARVGHPELRFELTENENPLHLLAEHFPYLQNPLSVENDFAGELPPFHGGLMGFVAYDCGRRFERIRGGAAHPDEPDLFFLECLGTVIFDRLLDVVYLVSLTNVETSRNAEIRALIERCALAPSIPSEHAPTAVRTFDEKFSRGEFCTMVERAKEYICAGDAFQIVLANSFTSDESVDPLSAFEHLHRNNPSPFHFLVRFGKETLTGASPEVMLRGKINGAGGTSEIAMRLVAGTYPKGESVGSQVSQAKHLAADSKERAEHLMLVDHARNDIGRVAEIGGVKVSDLFSIETYADVHHLVSQVSGVLRPGENALSALQSCFPIATLTGTPKIRAMEIISELEGPSRGIFGGAVVALGVDGSIDSTVAIRSLVTGPNGTKVQAGAGIVFDSSPEREYNECLWKAEAVFEAARGSER